MLSWSRMRVLEFQPVRARDSRVSRPGRGRLLAGEMECALIV